VATFNRAPKGAIGGTFSKEITAFVRATTLRADLVFNKVVLDTYGQLVQESPVDTGRFRAAWRVSVTRGPVGRVDRSVPPPRNRRRGRRGPTGGDPINRTEQGRALSGIKRVRLGDMVHITNSLPYARRLEDGWSKQAPKGWVRRIFNRMKASLNSIVHSVRNVR
jgi:hypothetical protein